MAGNQSRPAQIRPKLHHVRHMVLQPHQIRANRNYTNPGPVVPGPPRSDRVSAETSSDRSRLRSGARPGAFDLVLGSWSEPELVAAGRQLIRNGYVPPHAARGPASVGMRSRCGLGAASGGPAARHVQARAPDASACGQSGTCRDGHLCRRGRRALCHDAPCLSDSGRIEEGA